MNHLRAAGLASLVLAWSLGLSAAAIAQDLSTLPRDHPEITVVSTTGETTVGVLRRFDASSVTLDLDGQDRVFQKQAIARISQADSLKNGMLSGLAAGLAVGVVATVAACRAGIFSDGTRSCSADELFLGFGAYGALFGGAGLGIGAAVDAGVHRHRVLFQGTPGAAGGDSPVTLHLTPGAARVALRLRW